MYVCNMMTQPGETDNFTVNDHVHTLEKYLGKNSIDAVIATNTIIDDISEELQMQIVKKDVRLARYLNLPSYNVQKYLISRKLEYVKYLRKVDEKIIIDIVKRDYHLLMHIGTISPDLQLKIIKICPFCFPLIKK